MIETPTDQPVRAAPEQPMVGDPFAGYAFNPKGERVDLAMTGPLRGALRGLLRETAPAAFDASEEAVARQAEILRGLGHQGDMPTHAVNINLDRLSDPNGVNVLINSVAETLRPTMEQARRGTQSHEDTLAAADELFRRDEGFMLRREPGQAFNAEQITATRMVLATARDRTAELAQKVVAGGTDAETLLAFRRSLAQMAAVQYQLHGMAAEAGRALNAFKISATPGLMDLEAGTLVRQATPAATPSPVLDPAAATATTPPPAGATPPAASPSPTQPVTEGAAGPAPATAPTQPSPTGPAAPAPSSSPSGSVGPGSMPGAPGAGAPGAPAAPGQAAPGAGAVTGGQAGATAAGTMMTQDLLDLVNAAGGPQQLVQLAQAFLQLPTPASQNAMARASVQRDTADILGELWYNFVLSGPATHAVNMTGNAVTLSTLASERAIAAQWSKLFGFMGGEQGVREGEATAMVNAWWGALGDAWRLANFAFRHGETVGENVGYAMPLSLREIWRMSPSDAAQLATPGQQAGSKAQTGRMPAITGGNAIAASEDLLRAGAAGVNAVTRRVAGRNVVDPARIDARGALGRMTDLISLMIDATGGVIRTPTRMLGAEDQFWKTLAYRGEARARALREGSLSGLTGQQLEAYVDQAVNFMLPGDDAAAEAFARTVNMSESLQSQAALGLQRVGSSKLGYLFAPFVKVTANILDFSTQRVAFPVRPRWWKEAFSDDPVKRDLAMAKASTGALVWMTAMAAASTGKDANKDAPVIITGGAPTDPAEVALWRRAGYRPYSVRLGGPDGEWIEYNRLDPAGQILGIAADSVNLMANMDDVTAEEFGVALVAGIGNNLVNKSYMSSIAESMEVFTSYDQEMWRKWLQSRAASFVVPNALSQIAQADDPYLRKAVGIAEEIQKRRSAEGKRALPLTRDVAGYPIKQEWLFGTRFSGIGAGEGKPDPVAEEILRLEMNFNKPDKIIRGVELDEYQYDRYQQLAGHALKMPKGTVYRGPAVVVDGRRTRVQVDLSGLGMWDALGEVMKTPAYKRATDGADPPGQKVAVIADIQAMYRDAAQHRMFSEAPEVFEAMITAEGKAAGAQGLAPDAVDRVQRRMRAGMQRRVDQLKDYEVVE